jgi:tetratricopeptide (TPR) repeat protein
MVINRRLTLFLLFASAISGVFISACKQKSTQNSSSISIDSTLAQTSMMLTIDPKMALHFLDSVIPRQELAGMNDSVMTVYVELMGDLLIQSEMKDSAYHYIGSLYSTLGQEKHPKAKMHAGFWLIIHYLNDGSYKLAENYLEQIIPLSEKEILWFEKARALNLAGTILTSKGDYVQAQTKMLQAAAIFESHNDIHALGPVYLNIASNYMAMNDFQKALNLYRKAEAITIQHHDSINYQKTLNNLGSLYKSSSPDSAEYYFTKALNLLPLKPWSVESLSARFNLAGMFVDRKKFDKALEMYNDILELSKQHDIKKGVYRALSGIGNIYEAKNRNADALKVFQEGAELARIAGETPVQINLLEGIVYMYEKMGNYKDAYKVYRQQRYLSDSILTKEKQIEVHNLEILYNLEKTQRRNEALNASLILMKSRNRTNTIILILLIASALVLGFLLYRIHNLYRQRDRAYHSLIEQYKNSFESVGISEILPGLKPLTLEGEEKIDDPLFQKLIFYFETDKPYLKTDLKFDQVASHLKINRKQLLQLIQQETGMNFNSFVNKFRIHEALRLLADQGLKNYKIEVIAKESGFGSKANFYAVFTQVTGSKPSEYR